MGFFGSLTLLLIPAVSVLPVVVWRLIGWNPSGAATYAAGGTALALSILSCLFGGKFPGLTMSERFFRFAGLIIVSATVLVLTWYGSSVLVFAALGVAVAFPSGTSIPENNAQKPSRLALEALPYLAAAGYGFLLLLAFTPLDGTKAAGHLWQAGGAAWLALLGGVAVVESTRRRLPAKMLPLLGGMGAIAFAAVASLYFANTEKMGLPPWTYAAGLAVNGVVWTAAAALGMLGGKVTVSGILIGSAWHALGGWAYSLAFLIGAAAVMLLRRLNGWKAFESSDELVAVLGPSALLAAAGFFLGYGDAWRMGIGSFAAVFGIRTMEAVSFLWGRTSYRLLPPGQTGKGEPGAFTIPALWLALLVVLAAAFVPWFWGIGSAALGWAVVVTVGAAVGMAVEMLYAGTKVRLPKGLGAALVSPAVILALSVCLYRLFPRG